MRKVGGSDSLEMEGFFRARISRRDFLKKTCLFLAGLGLSQTLFGLFSRGASAKQEPGVFREAMFYKRLGNNVVQCEVCFRGCIIKEGRRSFCRNKENIGGELYNLAHSRPSAVQIDPIEKEPCLHMLPGTQILCFGTAGCNFRCKFCHNWHLSQRSIEEMYHTYDLSPEDAVRRALKGKVPTLSFTYNEPIAFYEYVYDCARLAKQKGLKVLWHTNGSLNPKPLRELLKYTDAVTVDLKGFTDDFYRNTSGAELQPVLRAMKIIREEGKWLEICHLHIPTLNDNPRDVERMCSWIKDELGKGTPLHFSRFFPAYRLTNLPPTPIEKLEQAYKIAKDVGLEYVTIGNVPGHRFNSTFCPSCKERLIHRSHFSVLGNNIVKGRCRFCGQEIPGIWG